MNGGLQATSWQQVATLLLRLVQRLFCTGGWVYSEGMKGGMTTGNTHGCLWIQQPCNAEVRPWRHGHCGWRTGGRCGSGGEGCRRSVWLPVLAHPALPISCLLKNAQLETLLSWPRQHPSKSVRPNTSFLLPSHISCQILPGVFKKEHHDL